MASTLSKVDQELIAENFEHRMRRRIFAASAYYSGMGKRRWQTQVANQKQPWRILRYSHITNPDISPLPLLQSDFTLPKTLRYHLYYLKRHYNVIPLQQLIESIAAGETINPRTVCLTFDGGYRDFYPNAFPLLQEFSLPATLFLPTAFIGTNQLFWTDKVILFMSILSYFGMPFPACSNLPNNFFAVLDRISTRREITPLGIALLVDALFEVSPSARVTTITEIGRIAEHAGPISMPQNFLSWEEIDRINTDPRISFASMTHSHGLVQNFSQEELKADRAQTLQLLAPFRHIDSVVSLPHGFDDPEIIRLLAPVGYRYLLARHPLPTQDPHINPSVLGRTTLFEDASFCTEFLACRLWNIKVGKYHF